MAASTGNERLNMRRNMNRKIGFYEKYIKRILDIICGLLAIVAFCWLYAIIALLIRIKLGKPVIYVTMRAGRIDRNTGKEREFKLYKFRSMTNDVDENGELLPDTERLTRFGRRLRATSLDELPEALNIIKGDMSVIGPRPLPLIYLPYYSEEERLRHIVRPGLSGYAQVNGRNSLSWEDKFKLDIEYVNHISFALDVSIIVQTVAKVVKREDIGQGENAPGSLHIIRANCGEKSQKQ